MNVYSGSLLHATSNPFYPSHYFSFQIQQQIGPDESHTIHKIRATTIIFEEDSSFDEPVIANIVLPNRPHATSLQVEEVGSFKFETNEQSVTYQVFDGSGDSRQGIIDEIDSDNEHSFSQKNRHRNVSIVSASEDENSVGYAREISVDEFQKDFQFEDGYANVKIKKTVVEEEEVYMGDFDDISNVSSQQPGKLYEVKETVDDEIDYPIPMKVNVSDISNSNLKSSGKALLCDVEEKEEHSSLSAEEAKQLRIKEIRAKARKATIVSKEDMTTDTVEDNRQTVEVFDQPDSQSKKANLLTKENADEYHLIDDETTPKYGKVNSHEANEIPQKGKERQLIEVELDDEFENLMKRAQRQRSILNDILDKEHGITSEEDVPQKSKLFENIEDSGSHPGIINSNIKASVQWKLFNHKHSHISLIHLQENIVLFDFSSVFLFLEIFFCIFDFLCFP